MLNYRRSILVSMTGWVVAVVVPAAAYAQERVWIRQFGSSHFDYAYAVASDGAQGAIVAGYTYGDMSGQNAGLIDAFIARFDSAGDQLWTEQFGTSNYDWAEAAATDGAGGVVVAGRTLGNLGGQNAGDYDVFLTRYTSSGEQMWMTQFGSNTQDLAHALAPDGVGGVFVAGETEGSLGGPINGGPDAFLARYDSAGNRLWMRQFGTASFEEALAVAPDGTGGVFVSGRTGGSLGGPKSGAAADAWVARFDSAGSQIWSRQFGLSHEMDYMEANSLAPDGSGGVIAAGRILRNASGEHAFVTRYDGAGNRLWYKEPNLLGYEHATAMASDGAGGVVVAGQSGAIGAFLIGYDGAGTQVWMSEVGPASPEDLAPDGVGGVMLAGWTSVEPIGGPSLGRYDGFIARYGEGHCYADCDKSTGNGVLDIFDFLCWQNKFMTGMADACDCNMSTGRLVCDVFDFLCFQSAFVAGCP